MPPARPNSLKFSIWLLLGIWVLSLGLGALPADPGQGDERSQALFVIDTSGNPHCQMPASVKVRQECEQDQDSLQQAPPQREFDLLFHQRIEKQLWGVITDLADLHRLSQPPTSQQLYSEVTLPVPTPPRLAFCCLRT